ncbi:hypothetical protein Y032_0226g2788 [Ancylostoma ceylanicum]|uniref:Uncharacterized protein n=1 Tax=Ancylostoma ceylanicum TaxID=53326 RepID=A0A016SI00_9BILA|nr:hypothetical protein Y032_0226g2788 [Ancylostoma ceylanicum]
MSVGLLHSQRNDKVIITPFYNSGDASKGNGTFGNLSSTQNELEARVPDFKNRPSCNGDHCPHEENCEETFGEKFVP